MKTLDLPHLAVLLALAIGLAAPAPALALADDDDKDDRKHQRWENARSHDRHDDRRDDYRDWQDDRRDARRDRVRVVYHEFYRQPPRYHEAPRRYGPPRWARGHRIHEYHWAPTYVIVDYHRYGLRHPPRDHHWRRDDRGDWLLVAIATGIIVDVVSR